MGLLKNREPASLRSSIRADVFTVHSQASRHRQQPKINLATVILVIRRKMRRADSQPWAAVVCRVVGSGLGSPVTLASQSREHRLPHPTGRGGSEHRPKAMGSEPSSFPAGAAPLFMRSKAGCQAEIPAVAFRLRNFCDALDAFTLS
jgi:hypothetical protein